MSGDALVEGQSGISAIQSYRPYRHPRQDRGRGAGRHPRGGRSHALRMGPGQGPEEDGPLHPSRDGGGHRGGRGFPAGRPPIVEDGNRTGVMIGSGIGGLETIYDASVLIHEGRGKRLSAVLHPVGADQPRLGAISRSNTAFADPNHGRRNGMRHRRARDRRRGPADHSRRRRRDGGRRRRGCGLQDSASRASAPSRALSTGFNDTPAGSLPAPGTRVATAS